MSNVSENLGAAWEVKFENSSKPKFNISLDAEKIKALPESAQGEVKLKFERQSGEGLSEKAPSHVVKFNDYKPGQERSSSEEFFMNINKEKLLKAADFVYLVKGGDKVIALEAGAKKNESVGKDRSDYFVRTREDSPEYVGRGWSAGQIVEKKEYVGNAFKKDFEDGGKAYNVSLKKDSLEKISADDYGNVRLSIAPKKDPTPGSPSHSVYQSVGKEPYNEVTLSLNKEKLMALPENDKGYVAVSVVDKLNISKDKADLTAYENTGVAQEKKNFVGGGWSNRPGLIRLQPQDKTPDGLTKAISTNYVLKVQAILQANPKVVQKKHVQLVKDMTEKGEKVEKAMSSIVANAYENKQGQKSGVKL